jgi:DNA-binding NtrC family response regulator
MTRSEHGRILVLDDDPMVTTTLEALIEEETAWEVAVFNHPHRALESIATVRYHAIVSDYMMPAMDGITFLGEVKNVHPESSRILLTGYADKANAIRSINEVGLYHYIEKPWDNDNLLLVLRNAMERTRLIERLDEKMRELMDGDRSLEELRASLLKAIL